MYSVFFFFLLHICILLEIIEDNIVYLKIERMQIIKIESDNITDKDAHYSLSLGILSCWKFVYTLLL